MTEEADVSGAGFSQEGQKFELAICRALPMELGIRAWRRWRQRSKAAGRLLLAKALAQLTKFRYRSLFCDRIGGGGIRFMSGGNLLRSFPSLFYVPSGKDFVANLSVYFFLLVLAGVFHYFTDVPDKIAAFLNPRAPSVSQSLLVLAIGFGLNFVPVFFAIDNYFMNVKQTSRAAIGTTACVCLLYTLLWKTFTSGLPHWRTFLSLFHGSTWPIALRMAMSGSLISVVTSFKLGFSGNLEAFDFKDVRRHGVVWNELVKRLETNNGLDRAEHEKMKKVTTGILDQLRGGGRMQKSVFEKARSLSDHMDAYWRWYDGVTKPGLNNLVGLTDDVRIHVAEIRKLL